MQASRMWPLGLLMTCRPWRRAPEWQVHFMPLSWLSLSASWPARKLRPEAGGRGEAHDARTVLVSSTSRRASSLKPQETMAAMWLYFLPHPPHTSLWPPFTPEARTELAQMTGATRKTQVPVSALSCLGDPEQFTGQPEFLREHGCPV